MGETTRGLGNQYAPHGDLDVRDARGQATTQKRATSVPTVHRGATTQRSVRLARVQEEKFYELGDIMLAALDSRVLLPYHRLRTHLLPQPPHFPLRMWLPHQNQSQHQCQNQS